MNYRIHTDAIKENLIPPELTPAQAAYTYANEADMRMLFCLERQLGNGKMKIRLLKGIASTIGGTAATDIGKCEFK